MLLILLALLLWGITSLHIVGGAILFHRFFRQESPWLGFIVPALLMVLVANFIEHFVALSALALLLPFTTLGLLIVVLRSKLTLLGYSLPGFSWEGLRLPTGIFLATFAFAFLIRCLHPNIDHFSDGLADLNIQTGFYQGETLPVTDMWLPPFKMTSYYTFQHYAAALLGRLLGIAPGVGSNLSHGLLIGLTGLVCGALGWRLSGGKIWITVLMPLLLVAAATGTSGYIFLTLPDCPAWLPDNFSDGLQSHPDNPLWQFFKWSLDHPVWSASRPDSVERLELQVPGFWTYRNEFHPNAGGHLLALLGVLTLLEITRKERSNFPWILAALIPFIAIVTTTWSLPITALICGGGLILALALGYRPDQPHFCLGLVALGLILLWPLLNGVLFAPQSPVIIWNTPYLHPTWLTPPIEFFAQWWPVVLLWWAVILSWEKLSWSVRWIVVVVPLMLIGIEWITIEDGRYNTIEKMWGTVYGVGLMTFLPLVADRVGAYSRLVISLVFFNSLLSLGGWFYNESKYLDFKNEAFHLQGDVFLQQDEPIQRIEQILSQLHQKTLITGKPSWAYNKSPAVATYTQNRVYVAWTFSEERYGHKGESDLREQEVNDFYAGKIAQPLEFLRARDIAAVVIWPEDNIPAADVEKFKMALQPTYEYIDCQQSGQNVAGVFLYRGGKN